MIAEASEKHTLVDVSHLKQHSLPCDLGQELMEDADQLTVSYYTIVWFWIKKGLTSFALLLFIYTF